MRVAITGSTGLIGSAITVASGLGIPYAGGYVEWNNGTHVERRYIDRVLQHTGGNKTRAAEVLGIDRRTLSRLFARERAETVDHAED